jgi:hypothetical protein
LASGLFVANGAGLFGSLFICGAENRKRYPATCPVVDNHSEVLAWGLVVGPTVLIVLIAIARGSTRASLIVGGASFALWVAYFLSLLVT